jgi:hypothetical protein
MNSVSDFPLESPGRHGSRKCDPTMIREASLMSTNASSLGHEPGAAGSIPSAAPPCFQWRVAFLRSLASAHVVAGVAELSRVAGNFLLQVG